MTFTNLPARQMSYRVRIARWMGRCLGAAIALSALPAWAADESRRDSILISLIIPLLVGAIVLAAIAIRTYRRDRARAQARRNAAIKRQTSRLTVAVPPLRHSVDAPTVVSSMVALNLSQSEGRRLPFPVPPQAEIKVCPTCAREFRTALASCPFDQTRLVHKSEQQAERPRDDYLDTRRSLMRCGVCDRSYDLGAVYCPYDGERLEGVDEDDDPMLFDGAMECPECSEVFDEDASFCPNDGRRLQPADASRGAASFGTVPIKFCRTCQREYPASLDRCPKDDSALLTMVGRTTGGQPAHGFGQLTKICPECGTRHGQDTRFCAQDATELRPLN